MKTGILGGKHLCHLLTKKEATILASLTDDNDYGGTDHVLFSGHGVYATTGYVAVRWRPPDFVPPPENEDEWDCPFPREMMDKMIADMKEPETPVEGPYQFLPETIELAAKVFRAFDLPHAAWDRGNYPQPILLRHSGAMGDLLVVFARVRG